MTSTALLHRVPARDLNPPMPHELHPAAQVAAANYHDMATSLDEARELVAQLKADLQVERRHNADLRRLLEIQTDRTDLYQRYAVRAMAHFEHICMSSKRAHEEAMKFADEPPPQEPPRTVPIDAEKLVAELSEAVQAAREAETTQDGNG